jgi:hypothetical protein
VAGHEIADAVVIEQNEQFALAEKLYGAGAPFDSQ